MFPVACPQESAGSGKLEACRFILKWSKDIEPGLFATPVAAMTLGVMGAMLTVTGIFGMAAPSISKRMRELGIRMAVGAQRKDVLEAALQRPFELLGWGSAAGLLLGVLASRALAAVVFVATPRDPLVLAVVMALVGIVATWIPAQRALYRSDGSPSRTIIGVGFAPR